ncbi:unnamed protein product [Ectocarpus sp. 12 AP-2014]
MINFLLLISRQGKTRLTKWYQTYSAKEKARTVREITSTVLARAPKMCNFVEWRDKKIVYKRYASLFFVACIDQDDNELITLEKIHLFVEVLDRYFGNVCELDIIFNFHKAYYILDELFIGGELQVGLVVGWCRWVSFFVEQESKLPTSLFTPFASRSKHFSFLRRRANARRKRDRRFAILVVYCMLVTEIHVC